MKGRSVLPPLPGEISFPAKCSLAVVGVLERVKLLGLGSLYRHCQPTSSLFLLYVRMVAAFYRRFQVRKMGSTLAVITSALTFVAAIISTVTSRALIISAIVLPDFSLIFLAITILRIIVSIGHLLGAVFLELVEGNSATIAIFVQETKYFEVGSFSPRTECTQ